jgi:Zn-dependent peptidase ImmA (M78 family)
MNYPNDGDLNSKPTPASISLEQATCFIIERAKQLVGQLIKVKGHDKPPFLPEEFARLLGVTKIVKADLGRTSGMLLRFHDGPVIKVNQNHNIARQNFSCAHEIGHMLYSELKLETYINSIEHRTYNPPAQHRAHARAIERLCDIVATELLMPESIFIKRLSFFGTSIYSIERMASIFHVSIRTAVRRIAEVSIEPCIELEWQKSRNDNLLRMVWCEGPGIRLTGKSNYAPKYTKVEYPSSLHKAYEQDSPVKCYRKFKIGKDSMLMPMESKAFGRGDNRYVVSLAYPER